MPSEQYFTYIMVRIIYISMW